MRKPLQGAALAAMLAARNPDPKLGPILSVADTAPFTGPSPVVIGANENFVDELPLIGHGVVRLGRRISKH